MLDYELEERYENFLREAHGETVKIAGHEYDTARALKDVDPTAYRCGFSDWLDSELGETLWEVDGEYYDEAPEDGDA